MCFSSACPSFVFQMYSVERQLFSTFRLKCRNNDSATGGISSRVLLKSNFDSVFSSQSHGCEGAEIAQRARFFLEQILADRVVLSTRSFSYWSCQGLPYLAGLECGRALRKCDLMLRWCCLGMCDLCWPAGSFCVSCWPACNYTSIDKNAASWNAVVCCRGGHVWSCGSGLCS